MKTKKLVKLLLLLVVLLGGIAFVLALINNSDKPNDKPDDKTDYNFKPLEFLKNIFENDNTNIAKSNDSGTFKLKVNTDNVNSFMYSSNFKTISDFITFGAYDLATLSRYDLKSFDVYSYRKTTENNNSYVPLRYSFKTSVAQSTESFEFYVYTKTTAERTSTFKPVVTITSIDVDLMTDLKNNKYIDLFDITSSGMSAVVDIKNDSIPFNIDGLDDDIDKGESYFILNDAYVKTTGMYDDYVERRSYVKNDIYPALCYNSFFDETAIDVIKPETTKFYYDKDYYTNRETNVLRLINNDLEYTVGKTYGLSTNGTYISDNPIIKLYKYFRQNSITPNYLPFGEVTSYDDNNYPIYDFKNYYLVQSFGIKGTETNEVLEFMLIYKLKISEIGNADTELEELSLYILNNKNVYAEVFTATCDEITFNEKDIYNPSSLTALSSRFKYEYITDINGKKMKKPVFDYSYVSVVSDDGYHIKDSISERYPSSLKTRCKEYDTTKHLYGITSFDYTDFVVGKKIKNFYQSGKVNTYGFELTCVAVDYLKEVPELILGYY